MKNTSFTPLVLVCLSIVAVLGVGCTCGGGDSQSASPTPTPSPAEPAKSGPPQAQGDWVLVKSGTFAPVHEAEGTKVTLTRDYYIQDSEVTQRQFAKLMGYNPSDRGLPCQDCPVENVTWHEAAAYCNELSKAEGVSECFTCSGSREKTSCALAKGFQTPYGCPGYRLPTEAEFENAALGGSNSIIYGPIDQISWENMNYIVSGDSGPTRPVKEKQPNGIGLYDVIGNVAEWCYDSCPAGEDDYCQELAGTDPYGAQTGKTRVVRGGSWLSLNSNRRSDRHNEIGADERWNTTGFRPVRIQ